MIVSFPEPGDRVKYRAFAGDVWDAVVTGVSGAPPHLFVDLRIWTGPPSPGPGGSSMPTDDRDPDHWMALRAVRWCAGVDGPLESFERPCAGWPGEAK